VTAPNPQADSRGTAPIVIADVAVKLALVALILVAIAYPDLGNVRGKAAPLRAIAYPAGVLIVPAIWWFRFRSRPFPWLGDLLVSLPWFTDTLGNRLNLFDALSWFDDWMHFMNWGLLTAGLLLLTLPAPARWWRTLERALALGVSLALGWELAEYVAFIRTSPELGTAYTDTLGDLTLGTTGSIVAALVVWFVRSRPRLIERLRRARLAS
jgi:hypothetical protein